MAPASFKVGDTVRLKSGGPLMTIGGMSENGKLAACVWFSVAEQKTGQFPAETLKPIERPPAAARPGGHPERDAGPARRSQSGPQR